MGYEGVDFAGYYGYDAPTIRAMLDDLGLKVAGCHTGIQTLLGDELPETVEFNRILGNKYLIVPGLPEAYRNSRDAWLKTAGTLQRDRGEAQARRDVHRLPQPPHRVRADGRRDCRGTPSSATPYPTS